MMNFKALPKDACSHQAPIVPETTQDPAQMDVRVLMDDLFCGLFSKSRKGASPAEGLQEIRDEAEHKLQLANQYIQALEIRLQDISLQKQGLDAELWGQGAWLSDDSVGTLSAATLVQPSTLEKEAHRLQQQLQVPGLGAAEATQLHAQLAGVQQQLRDVEQEAAQLRAELEDKQQQLEEAVALLREGNAWILALETQQVEQYRAHQHVSLQRDLWQRQSEQLADSLQHTKLQLRRAQAQLHPQQPQSQHDLPPPYDLAVATPGVMVGRGTAAAAGAPLWGGGACGEEALWGGGRSPRSTTSPILGGNTTYPPPPPLSPPPPLTPRGSTTTYPPTPTPLTPRGSGWVMAPNTPRRSGGGAVTTPPPPAPVGDGTTSRWVTPAAPATTLGDSGSSSSSSSGSSSSSSSGDDSWDDLINAAMLDEAVAVAGAASLQGSGACVQASGACVVSFGVSVTTPRQTCPEKGTRTRGSRA